jgi:hypothetical protein
MMKKLKIKGIDQEIVILNGAGIFKLTIPGEWVLGNPNNL